MAAKFLITLGDEFQGLLVKPNHLLEIIDDIQREIYPVRLRFGVGIGKITTQISPEAAIGSDGPAFYAARNIIESIHEQEKKEKNRLQISRLHFMIRNPSKQRK